MKFSTEYDKGKLHEYFIWEIFQYVRFGDEVIFYTIVVERQISITPPE